MFPALLLHIPMVQERIASEAEKELSALLHAPVTVGRADIESQSVVRVSFPLGSARTGKIGARASGYPPQFIRFG